MATDIAFAIGVMALLGKRIPFGLKVFLTALAIADDIAAVLVIAVFYTSEIVWGAFGLAIVCALAALLANRSGIRHPLPYLLIGVAAWLTVLQSGVHATVAGIVLAFMIPSRTVINHRDFLRHSRWMLESFEKSSKEEAADGLNSWRQQTALQSVEDACEKVQPPLQRLERQLHPWVMFGIMPLFALANAGVSLPSDFTDVTSQPIILGVAFGLVLGKPIGIMLASWLVVRLGFASLPEQVSWKQIHGAAWLAGIGFTMSIFIAGLAFTGDAQLAEAKIGVLLASICAALVGSAILLQKPAA